MINIKFALTLDFNRNILFFLKCSAQSLLFICIVLFLCTLAYAQLPNQQLEVLKNDLRSEQEEGYFFVYDFAQIYSLDERQILEDFLRTVEQNTTYEFVVVTVDSLNGYSSFDVAFSYAESLEIGKADVDNGLLLLIAESDREYYVVVGQGYEGTLTDLRIAQVTREKLVPALREENYARGTFDTLAAFALISLEDESTISTDLHVRPAWVDKLLFFGFLIFLILLFALLSYYARNKGGNLGGLRRSGGLSTKKSGHFSHSFGGGRFGGGGSGGRW
jgi:uncharacterized protein